MSGTVDGLTDVNRYNNFCDASSLAGYNCGEFYQTDDALMYQEKLLHEHNIKGGHSSGACYWLADQVRQQDPDAKIAFVCADGMERTVGSNSFESQGRYAGMRSFSSTPDKNLWGSARRRNFSTTARTNIRVHDHIVVGGGPVGTATAWQLGERNAESEGDESVLLIHDPKNAGAHEDWSRLARLSFDGPADELELSRHAIELLKTVDEVRSYQSGAPVVPVSPGMLFLASPGTPMAKACAYAEANYNDPDFVR